jgi:hypothetical protein
LFGLVWFGICKNDFLVFFASHVQVHFHPRHGARHHSEQGD